MDCERIFYLLDRHADGGWTTEEKQELEENLLNSPEVQGWFWEHSRLSTLLREACQRDAGREMAEVDVLAEQVAVPAGLVTDESASVSGFAAGQQPSESRPDATHSLGIIGDVVSAGGSMFNVPKLLALTIVAMLVGSGVTACLLSGKSGAANRALKLASHVEPTNSQESPIPAATLANITNCRWGPARSTADLQSDTVRPGQSLNLLEGVAEISAALPGGGIGRFQLEGPLGMILTSQGMPSLQYGKLTAQVMSGFGRFTLETPLGRVAVHGDSSIGIIVAASDVELHVFTGVAMFEPWSTGFEASEPLNVASRDSLRIRVAADEKVSIERGKAHDSWFVSTASMAASRLLITERYVRAIREADPVAYWRFEEADSRQVRNEMSDRFHCRVEGNPIRWHLYRGNHYAEFGSTTEGGCLMSGDTFDEVLDESYAVEAWIKPSHFHHGTVLSLLQYSPQEPTIVSQHSMVVELCGAVAVTGGSVNSWMRHPGRIRFVHRNPPGDIGGASCFSEVSYALRKWQHVVCNKDQAALRLYIDGKLAAQAEDSTTLAPGVRALIGQLRPHDSSRPVAERQFIGEMDEVALYDRPLSEQEIVGHYELVQSPADPVARQPARDY